jgi:large subunit ribosomal protein L14
MLQIRSRLDVADNTGARMAKMIGVIGKKNSPEAHVGDVITAHIREASAGGTVKKGDVVRAVVVRTRHPIRRNDGSYLRFDNNAIVIIDKIRIRVALVSSAQSLANSARRTS